MKTFLTILLTGILIGCGTSEQPVMTDEKTKKEPVTQNDPYLQQYMNHFYGICIQTTASNRCKENLKKFKSINFVDSFNKDLDPNGTVAGVCWWTKYSRRVEIKRNITQPGSMKEKALIFHELGHCLLDLGHSDPSTKMLMNPYLSDESTYVSNWTRLQKELFQLVLSLLLADQMDLSDDEETPIF